MCQFDCLWLYECEVVLYLPMHKLGGLTLGSFNKYEFGAATNNSSRWLVAFC